MTRAPLSIAYVPLVDAAPVIVAAEMGFAEEEGLDLSLVRAPSWSAVRDWLAFGAVDAAHLLSPIPVAMALGLGGVPAAFSALLVLSVGGCAVGVSRALADRIEDAGPVPRFDDAAASGRALAAAARGRLRIGVPFPFSMHAELLFYWLSASGLPAPEGIDIRSVPPPHMADAIASGDIDAFCVGEPWGSRAVETGTARLIAPTTAIWTAAPEKVLAVRTDWAEAEPELTGRLMRAVWKAQRWLDTGGAATTAAEILSRDAYLALPAEMIDRALTGHLVVTPDGDTRSVPAFLRFWDGAVPFPWKSQAAWIGTRMAARLGLDRAEAVAAAEAVFRTDLYRRHLAQAGAPMPGASSKVEGGIAGRTAVASATGRLLLAENRFFDDRIFDPTAGN